MKKTAGILLFLVCVSGTSGCGYNRLQTLDEGVKAAWAEVESQYQRRHDLIPNLVEVVKGYAKHERETLNAVVSARARATETKIQFNSLGDTQAFAKFREAQQGLSQALSRLMVVVEKYPDLKANENFRDLQSQLEGTENRITVARKRYIDSVADYNVMVRHFPTNLTAKYLLHLGLRETFSAAAGAKEVPQVKF